MIKKLDRKEMSPQIKAAYDKSIALRGEGRFFETFANHPDLYDWYVDSFYKQVFYSDTVDRKYKELLRLKLSTTHGCKFCNQGNSVDALEAGISEEQIKHIDQYQEGPFDEQEKLVLELADQISLRRPNGNLSEDLYQRISKYFSDKQILELGMVAGILTGIAKFLFSFDLVEREEYCQFNPGHQ